MIGWSCNKHIHCKRKYFLLHTNTPLLQYILFRLSYKLFLILETLITRTECFFYKWTQHAMPSRYAAVTMTCIFFLFVSFWFSRNQRAPILSIMLKLVILNRIWQEDKTPRKQWFSNIFNREQICILLVLKINIW